MKRNYQEGKALDPGVVDEMSSLLGQEQYAQRTCVHVKYLLYLNIANSRLNRLVPGKTVN